MWHGFGHGFSQKLAWILFWKLARLSRGFFQRYVSCPKNQDVGKGGLSLRGVAVVTVLAVLAVLESTLLCFCLSYKTQHNETTVAVLTVLALSVVMAVSVMTATPLNSTPLFGDPEKVTTNPRLPKSHQKSTPILESFVPLVWGLDPGMRRCFWMPVFLCGPTKRVG